jgi:cyclic pyranopterin phosphate synthase
MGMVDISEKPAVRREAEAAGRISLSSETIDVIRSGRIKKGDTLFAAEIAAMNAAKQSPLIIHH